MALKFLLNMACIALPAAAFALPGAKCHADPCLALIRKGASSPGGRGACHAFFAVTVVPGTVTSVSTTTSSTTSVPVSVVTSIFTETSVIVASTDILTDFETDTVTSTMYQKRSTGNPPTTLSRTAVPPYAQRVCTDVPQYSSACSCVIGATYRTTTAPTPTSTVLKTETSVLTSISTTTTVATTITTTKKTTSTTTTSSTTVEVTTLPTSCAQPQRIFKLKVIYPNFHFSYNGTFFVISESDGRLYSGFDQSVADIFTRDINCNLVEFQSSSIATAVIDQYSTHPVFGGPDPSVPFQLFFDENNKLVPQVQGSTNFRPKDLLFSGSYYFEFTPISDDYDIDVYAVFLN